MEGLEYTDDQLIEAGFSSEEVSQWRAGVNSQLMEAGFSQQEIDSYYGVKQFDDTDIKDTFNKNFEKRRAAEAEKTQTQTAGQEPQTLTPQVKEADSFLEALEAGWDMSVSGLMMDAPDKVLSENADMYYRIASQIGTIAGDLPFMGVGAFAGGATGAGFGAVTLPVVGAVPMGAAGAAAGAFALPEAMRTSLMQHYEKGDVTSFRDFWERTGATLISGLKGGTIGLATAGAGGLVAKGVAKTALPVAAKTTAQLSTEVATMVTVGAALEGHAPEPEHFLEAALVLGAFKGVTGTTAKLRQIYGKSGKLPAEVVQEAQTNPKLKQELLADNVPAEKILGQELPPIEGVIEVTPPLKSKPNVSESAQKILSKVGEKKEATKGKLNKQMAIDKGKEVYRNFVDKLDPINEATKILSKGGETLAADKNPYILSRMAVDYKAKAKHFFEKGTLDFKTREVNGQGLRQIIEKVDNLEEFKAYTISKRVLDKELEFKAVKDRNIKAQEYKSKLEKDIAAEEVKIADANKMLEAAKTDKAKNSIIKLTNLLQERKAHLEQKVKDIVFEKESTTGFDVAAAKAVVKESGKKYEKVAKELTEFSNKALQYVADSGVLSKEDVAKIKVLNENYVPFKRIIETTEGGVKTKAGKAGSLKKFKGSDLAIQDPITSILENTVELIRMAEVNRPKLELVKLAEKVGEQNLIERVKEPPKPVKISEKEVARLLDEAGIDSSIAEPLVTFRRVQRELRPNEFAVYKDGKSKIYKTTPELADAINGLGGDVGATNMAFRLMRGITQFKKVGITFTPDFILRNLIRDKVTSSVFSKSEGLSPVDVLGAMGDIMKKSDDYYRWYRSGGANGAFLELSKAYLEKDIIKLQNQTNFLGSARNVMKKPVDLMRVAAELSEQSIRLAEFKKVSGGAEGGTKLVEGGFAAREVTLDFQRVGAKMSALNSITAFLNVSVQGLDKTARAVKENPKAVATRSLTYITAPSILLWWANKDDPRYQELPAWQKDWFWIIPTDKWESAPAEEASGLPDYMVRQTKDGYQINKGTIYRIPKPMELGIVFGTLPERVLSAFFTDNPHAFKDFSDAIMKALVPSLVPDAVAPVIEQYFNKSFFTGNDVIPHHLKEVSPEYQFVNYTSDTAKTLGKLIATVDKQNQMASPVILDNYIRSWGGSLGQYTVQLADMALRKAGVAEDIVKPTATLSDIPFIKAFTVRFPTAGAASIQDFYDNYKESDTVFKTIKHLAKQGDFESMQKELALQENQEKMIRLDGIKDALANQNATIRMIDKMPDMSADEKRQMIDGIYLGMIEIAKEGNKTYRELKKAAKEK